MRDGRLDGQSRVLKSQNCSLNLKSIVNQARFQT